MLIWQIFSPSSADLECCKNCAALKKAISMEAWFRILFEFLRMFRFLPPCSCRPVFAYPTFVYSISLTITSTYPFERKQACAHSCADLILFCSGVNSCYSGSEIIDFLCSSSMHHGPMISKLSPIIVHSSRDSPQNCDL